MAPQLFLFIWLVATVLYDGSIECGPRNYDFQVSSSPQFMRVGA